jgi:CHAD domain-containing protein
MSSDQGNITTIIIAYLGKYLDRFASNLEQARIHFEPESIHEYRVAVKRIRAVARAVNQATGEEILPDSLILPLRLMFKAGGPIRDDQVQTELVEQLEQISGMNFPLIKQFYRKRIDNQRDQFFVRSVDFDYPVIGEIRNQMASALSPMDPEGLEANLYEWLRDSMEKLRKKRFSLEDPDRLHRFRTRFKEKGYIVEMLYFSEYDYHITKTAFNRIKDFGQELGTWHDHYQLWSKTAFIFQESKDVRLLEEAFEMRKLITPVHDRLFQEMLHLIKRDDTLFTL